MKLGTIKGIEIKLHFSTLLIVGLVGFYAAQFYLSLVPDVSIWELILVGIINGIIIIFSILIHELSHSIMAQRSGLKVSEIELYLFGGISKIEEEPKTPKSEFIITVVGPASSLILGGALLTILFVSPIILPAWLIITLFYSGITNIGLGIFNLIPAFPMDGGRVLRAILWKKRNNLLSATKTAAKVGSFFGYSLIGLGVIQIIFGGLFGGLWLIFMGSFLRSSAKQSYIQTVNSIVLSKITVREIMTSSQKFVIPSVMPLNEAIRDYFMIFKQIYFPVVREGGELVGIIHLEDVKKIPIEQRSEIVVENVMKKFSEFPTIYEYETGKDVMKKLHKMEKKPRIAVIKETDDRNVIGFIDELELFNAIKFWELSYLDS